jgi:glutathione S-transferase
MRHFDIPFTEKFIRLRTPETAANLARISPTGTVPVLYDGDKVVWETIAILEYLNEQFPHHYLWPKDPDARCMARCAAAEMHSGFVDVRYGWPMNLRRPPRHKPLEGDGDRQRLRIEELWHQCRTRFGKDGPFLFGRFSAADAMYAPVVTRFHTYGGELSGTTRDYVDAMLDLPAMRQWYREAAAETWPEPGPDE